MKNSCSNKYKIIMILLFFLIILYFILDYRYYILPKIARDSNISFAGYLEKYIDSPESAIESHYINDKIIEKGVYAFRKVENKSSKKQAILIFGDMYASGYELGEKESLSYHLGAQTSRPIWDRSEPNSAAQHMYYQLKNDKFYNEVPKPQYIFYIYTARQVVIASAKLNNCHHQIYYKLKNGKLIKLKHVPLYNKSFLVERIHNLLFQELYIQKPYFAANQKLFTALVVESKREAEKHWGKEPEFVIIKVYDFYDSIEAKMFEEFKKEGFIIFDLFKHINLSKEYRIKGRYRPNSQGWQKIVQVLVKEFNIK